MASQTVNVASKVLGPQATRMVASLKASGKLPQFLSYAQRGLGIVGDPNEPGAKNLISKALAAPSDQKVIVSAAAHVGMPYDLLFTKELVASVDAATLAELRAHWEQATASLTAGADAIARQSGIGVNRAQVAQLAVLSAIYARGIARFGSLQGIKDARILFALEDDELETLEVARRYANRF